MRAKKMTLVITFASTAMAMKMEKEMHALNAPGRIIPVPKAITASCGLAYIADPEDEEQIRQWMTEKNVEADQIVTMML